MLITKLSARGFDNVVERQRLEDAVAELRLGRPLEFNQESTARIGKLLGAKYLVLGSFFEFRGTLRIDARVVEVETGLTILASGVDGKTDRFTSLVDKLVEGLSRGMPHGIVAELSKGKDDRSFVHYAVCPAEVTFEDWTAEVTFEDTILYGRVLDSLDRGDTRSARESLTRLVAAARDFVPARTLLRQLPSEEAERRDAERQKQREIVRALQEAAKAKGVLKEGERCPKCGFSYAWDGVECHHCHFSKG